MPEPELHARPSRPTHMRLFIGLPTSMALGQALVRHVRTTNLANARWTPPENLHLTLVFLGKVRETGFPCLLRELNDLEPPRIRLRLTGIGSFPRAGVLFAEVEPAPRLLSLQKEVAVRMTNCGFALDERPYHPHITLARLRQPARIAGQHIALPSALLRSFSADVVNLYRSSTAGGPRYQVLAQKRAGVPLVGAAMEAGCKMDGLADPSEQE